jgi:hypothetical protein
MRLQRSCRRPATKSGGSASIGGQLLRAGLVDEVRIHLAPVLLGAGTRLLDDDDDHVRLQPTRITESSKATYLRYRVQTDLEAPHFTERVAGAQTEVGDRERTLAPPGPDRELLSNTLSRLSSSISRGGAGEQLLHGEPHPGNLLSTRRGPLFVDLGGLPWADRVLTLPMPPKRSESIIRARTTT